MQQFFIAASKSASILDCDCWPSIATCVVTIDDGKLARCLYEWSIPMKLEKSDYPLSLPLL